MKAPALLRDFALRSGSAGAGEDGYTAATDRETNLPDGSCRSGHTGKPLLMRQILPPTIEQGVFPEEAIWIFGPFGSLGFVLLRGLEAVNRTIENDRLTCLTIVLAWFDVHISLSDFSGVSNRSLTRVINEFTTSRESALDYSR